MGRYYGDYHQGSFPNQRPLNEAINPINANCLLQTDEANPLTIRLLVAKDAISRFDDLIKHESINKLQTAITVLDNDLGINAFSQGMFWGTASVNFTSGSGIACPTPHLEDPANVYQSRAVPVIFRREGSRLRFVDEQGNAFPLVNAHIDVYNFFTNYGSALDRFSNEINRLYGLGLDPRRIDWPFLANNTALLNAKNSQLRTRIDSYYRNQSFRLLRYRNRLVHDGVIRLNAIVDNSNNWVVWAPTDPDNINSPMSENALLICQSGFNELIQFLDDCYGFMLAQIRSGQPPW